MNGEKKNSKKHGFILGFLYAFCYKISALFSSGSVFGCLNSYYEAESLYRSSATVGVFKTLKRKISAFFEAIRIKIAKQFERSLLLGLINFSFDSLLNTSSRVFGAFSLTWSVYALLIAIIKRYVALNSEGMLLSVSCAVIVLLASIPMLFTDKSIIMLASESKIVSSFLIFFVGVTEEALNAKRPVRTTQSYAVVFGIVLGALTYVISPIYMIVGFFALIAIALVMSFPECGVILSIASAPLMGILPFPSISLAAIVLFTALAYMIKVIRGKRVFNCDIAELAVCFFMFAIFLGAFAPGESNTFENAVLTLSLMLIFPLTVNLMKYKHWIKTCVTAFTVPLAVVSFIGVAQYLLGNAPEGWIDSSLFSGITARATSVFNNPNILGVYLVMIFPFSLKLTLPGHDRRVRILGVIVSAVAVVCVIFTYSRAAWIALIVGSILFAVFVSPKGVLWLIPAVTSVVVASVLFPETIGSRILNFITLSDSANSYRVSVWNSSWNMFFDLLGSGIGMGEEAFKTAYINFALDGTHAAMHSHSLFLQIGIQLGLIGLFIFLVSVALISCKCLTAVVNKRVDGNLSLSIKAAMAGVVSLVIAGMFDYTWYNFRIMFIFWALLGLSCAAVNVGARESNRSLHYYSDENSAFVTVLIPQRVARSKESKGEEMKNE